MCATAGGLPASPAPVCPGAAHPAHRCAALGDAGAGADSDAEIRTTTEAFLDEASITAAGLVEIASESEADVESEADGVAVSQTAVGVTRSDATVRGKTRVWLGGEIDVAASSLKMIADGDNRGDAHSVAAAGGLLLGVSAADADSRVTPTISATLGDLNSATNTRNVNIGAGGIQVVAMSSGASEAEAEGSCGKR